MKRIIALILSCAICLTACGSAQSTESVSNNTETESVAETQDNTSESVEEEVSSTEKSETEEQAIASANPAVYQDIEDQKIADENLDLSDENLQQYLRDRIYTEAIEEFDSDEYCVENVQTIYYSKEYIEQLAYNSQKNLYFGFTQAELDSQFQGKKYVFTLDENTGETTVVEVELYEDYSTEEILKNVAIGTGVILVCVTVSVATGGTAPAVSAIFALGAKTGTAMALSGGAIGGLSAGLVKGYQTGSFSDAMNAAALGASDGFKWGAIVGALSGGATEAWGLHKATATGLTMNEVAAIQRESKYPLDLISQFKSKAEYEIYRDAGLRTQMVNGKLALVRDIDLNYKSSLPDGTEVTNLQRMQKGYAPLDPATGKAYQLHHINQDPNGTLAILKEAEHQGNSSILNNPDIVESKIDREAFSKIRKAFWTDLENQFAAAL